MRKILLISFCFLLSSCHVGKYLVYNFANINDYKKFHHTDLEKATEPFYFEQTSNELSLSMDKYGIYSESDLASFNADHKTVAFLLIKNDSIQYEWYAVKYEERDLSSCFQYDSHDDDRNTSLMNVCDKIAQPLALLYFHFVTPLSRLSPQYGAVHG